MFKSKRLGIILLLFFFILPHTLQAAPAEVIDESSALRQQPQGAPPVKKDKKQKKKKKLRAKKKRSPYRFIYEVEGQYNDNVYEYSNSAIKQYEGYKQRDTRFKHVEGIDDFVTRIYLDFSRSIRLFEKKPTRVGVWGDFDIYARNSILDEQNYAFYILQQLNKKTSLELDYVYTPYNFVKYLLDVDIPLIVPDRFVKAYYRENEVDMILRYRPYEDWYFRLRYRLELDDYNGAFKERSCVDNSARIDAVKYWAGRKARTGIYYEYTDSSARAKDDDPANDVDDSYEENKLGFLLTLPLLKKIKVEAEYYYAYRRFTSDLPLSEDPLHRDRIDRIQRAEIYFIFPLTKKAEWFLGYEYKYRDPTIKASGADLDSEPYVGYVKNIAKLGIRGEF